MASNLFRSEPMLRCQIFLQHESAYQCVSELGELDIVQFMDSNPEMSAFQRKFVKEVKRCDELERILHYITSEADEPLVEPIVTPRALGPSELTQLEVKLSKGEETLSDLSNNFRLLLKNRLELLELRSVLNFAESTLSGHMGDQPSSDTGSMKFNIVAGVVDRSKFMSFERMLWRVSKGNIFLKSEAMVMDELTQSELDKTVKERCLFLIFFQGEELKSRVKKICDGFYADIFPCPDSSTERKEMLDGVQTRLADLSMVLSETTDQRTNFINELMVDLAGTMISVRKMKAVYHTLNLFKFDGTGNVLVAESWMPRSDEPAIRDLLSKCASDAGSVIAPVICEIPDPVEVAPTFNRVNKYTSGFQNLVDAYGANTYREINPAVYTIATFPFLFAIMFGDAGHGLILLLFGLFLVVKERDLHRMAERNEIFGIFFGGRYIITMMGAFSIYTGLIYNDIFSKSFNIFGSHWAPGKNFTYPLKLEDSEMLDPGYKAQYMGHPYAFGMDPAWQHAKNKITFLNGYKMKISLIFGLLHMVFGVSLSAWNKTLKRNYIGIVLEFVPQIVFLVFIFCYLIFLIFFKWVSYHADVEAVSNPHSEHCAPNLLITFINMMLFKQAEPDEKLVEICKGYETYMYPGQDTVQKFLVVSGVLMIPVMLFGKPLYERFGRTRRNQRFEPLDSDEAALSASADNEDEEEDFTEVMIYQGIHTIEYVLGSVSHTASYLRLWALSLAHSQLSEVLWTMVMAIPLKSFGNSFTGAFVLYLIFAAWSALTLSILVLMEGLSAFLHTLRLHWVEFQSKFYEGQGVLFHPFSYKSAVKDALQIT